MKIQKSVLSTSFFLFLLIGLFLFIGHWKSAFHGPEGLHFTRQSDSLSFVLHYFLYDWNFFSPGTLNLESDGGKAACEFPIYYYLTALIFLGTGVKLYVLKWLYLLTVYLGLYHALRLGEIILKNRWLAGLTLFPLFTSTVFHYYTFNFLPDAPALGLTFSGFYFLSRNGINFKEKKGWYALLAFTLAGLIKITFFLYPVAILVLSCLHFIFKKQSVYFQLQLKSVFQGILLSALVIVAWNLYAYCFNFNHHSNYFLGEAKPYWVISKEVVSEVWSHIIDFWYTSYFAHTTYHFIALLGLFTLLFYRKINFELGWMVIIQGFGIAAYFLLFFQQFQDHDYYMLVSLPFFYFLSLPILQYLHKGKKILITLVSLTYLAMCIPGVNYARMKMEQRRKDRVDMFSIMNRSIEKSKPQLHKFIGNTPTMVIMGDPSKNGSLLALEKFGWQIPIDQSFDQWLANNQVNPKFVLCPSDSNWVSSKATLVFSTNQLQLFELAE